MDGSNIRQQSGSGRPPPPRARDSWEDWEEEDNTYTPIDDNVQLVPSIQPVVSQSMPSTSIPSSQPTQAAQMIMARQNSKSSNSNPIFRLKSRRRQKYQNEQAGITLITDMEKLRYAQSQNSDQQGQEGRRFVDAATLRAIVNPSKQQQQVPEQPSYIASASTSVLTDSPDNGRVIIGIAMSLGSFGDREISPQTAVIETPLIDFGPSTQPAQIMPTTYRPGKQPAAPQIPFAQQKPGWSPDTPDTAPPNMSILSPDTSRTAPPDKSIWSPDTPATSTPFEQTPISITFSSDPAPSVPEIPHSLLPINQCELQPAPLHTSNNPFAPSPTDAASCYPISIFDKYDSETGSPQTPFDGARRQRTPQSATRNIPSFFGGETKKMATNKEIIHSPSNRVQYRNQEEERTDAFHWLDCLTDSPLPVEMSVAGGRANEVKTTKGMALPVVPLIQSEGVFPVEDEEENAFDSFDFNIENQTFDQNRSVANNSLMNTDDIFGPVVSEITGISNSHNTKIHHNNFTAITTNNSTTNVINITNVTNHDSPKNWWEEQSVYEKFGQLPKNSVQDRTFIKPQSATFHHASSSAQSTPRIQPSPGLSLASATMASSDRPIFNANKLERTETLEISSLRTDNILPPYSPPRPQKATPFRGIFPSDHPFHSYSQQPPSPGPISPGFSRSIGRGGVALDEIPLTPAMNGPSANGHGTFYHYHTYINPHEYRKKAEKRRRRWEKEEKMAIWAGGLWQGRGCISERGCYGRGGAEGRRRRRCWLVSIGIILTAITVATVVGVLLGKKKHHTTEKSIWVNITGFPPMPTGVLTVVAPDNDEVVSSCTEPSTMWSCSLPKELQDDVDPFSGNQPTVTLSIQYDNGTDESWKTAWESSTVKHRSSPNFTPQPEPPSTAEMAFLGNTTDDVQSDTKEGEPTPFYISMLDMNDNATLPGTSENAGTVVTQPRNITLPIPQTKNDGTAADARLFPRLWQQPVRLFDRGLATEHYGFYQYFRRTIYVTNINSTIESGSIDQNGGAPIDESTYIVTWAQMRVKVTLWTNMGNTTALLGASSDSTAYGLFRPGSMPYPVMINLDTHGGNPDEKVVWAWEMSNSKVDTRETYFIANEIGVGGAVVNPRGTNADDSLGGYDGGVGGCKCEWQNYIMKIRAS